jgi:hypothetical protein
LVLVLVRILYLADIRFPLERANGIQSMETCHALADRGRASRSSPTAFEPRYTRKRRNARTIDRSRLGMPAISIRGRASI